MVWSQFSIKILGVHFGNSVLHNSNLDQISHRLTKKKKKKKKLGTGCNSLWDEKQNYKLNSPIQALVYRSNIHYSKIYHKGTRKKYSLTPYLVNGLGILDIDAQLNFLELKWI